MNTLTANSTLTILTCGSCHIKFAMPKEKYDACMNSDDGGPFYCPNGHKLYFCESEAMKLRKQLASKERSVNYYRSEYQEQRMIISQQKRRIAGYKGVVTRKNKKLSRVKNGVCPCCNRSFKNLHRHMQTQHPEYDPECKE